MTTQPSSADLFRLLPGGWLNLIETHPRDASPDRQFMGACISCGKGHRTPNCSYSPDGLWHCFACSAGGSAVDYVKLSLKCDTSAAFAHLRHQAGLPPLTSRKTRRPKPDYLERGKTMFQAALKRVGEPAPALDIYCKRFRGIQARQYVVGQKGSVRWLPLDDPVLSKQEWRMNQSITKHLKKHGIDKISDRSKAGLLLISYQNQKGDIGCVELDLIGSNGKRPDQQTGDKEARYRKYYGSPKGYICPVFDKSSGQAMTISEGWTTALMSARALHQRGEADGAEIKAALACGSSSNMSSLTSENVKAWADQLGCPQIILLADGDAAGRLAARSAARACRAADLPAVIVPFPAGKDAADYGAE